MTDLKQGIEDVLGALRTLRVHVVTEEFLIHDQIKKVFADKGIDYEHERKLGARKRIDFLVSGGIGVEVKKGKPNRNAVMKQLEKYASSDEVSVVILVIERSMDVPREMYGKPCYVIGLNKLWF